MCASQTGGASARAEATITGVMRNSPAVAGLLQLNLLKPQGSSGRRACPRRRLEVGGHVPAYRLLPLGGQKCRACPPRRGQGHGRTCVRGAHGLEAAL